MRIVANQHSHREDNLEAQLLFKCIIFRVTSSISESSLLAESYSSMNTLKIRPYPFISLPDPYAHQHLAP